MIPQCLSTLLCVHRELDPTVSVNCAVCAQGSGWGWLGYNKASKALEIATCANQDPLAAKVRLALQVRQAAVGTCTWQRGSFHSCSSRTEQPVMQHQSNEQHTMLHRLSQCAVCGQ